LHSGFNNATVNENITKFDILHGTGFTILEFDRGLGGETTSAFTDFTTSSSHSEPWFTDFELTDSTRGSTGNSTGSRGSTRGSADSTRGSADSTRGYS